MKTTKNPNDALDLYFDKNDKPIYVPEKDIKTIAADQTMVEVRGFNHLRAVKNADGSYAGIHTMFRVPADEE